MQLNSKELLILYYLLRDNEYVTAEQLSNYCFTSVRTVRTKVNQLNNQLEGDGIIIIESIHAKGYRITILNQESFVQFKEHIISLERFYRKVGIEKMTRRIFISQQLLSNKYIKQEQLAMQLYMTVSGLKKDMQWIHQFFNSFDVTIQSKPGFGLYVSGKEKNIRLLMVEAFCSQYNFIDKQVERFSAMFYNNFNEYQKIRRSFLKIIRESCYAFTDIYSKKLSTYLILTRSRCKVQKYVSIEEDCKEELKNRYELSLAKESFKIQGLFEEKEIPEDELYYFALLLTLYRDYDFSNNKSLETYNQRYLNETILLLSRSIKEASKIFGVALYQMELFTRYESKFLSPLYNIYLNYVYGSNKQWILTTYFEGLENVYSPFAIYYSRILLLKIEKDLGITIDKTQIYKFIMLYDLVLKKVNFPYKKRRLALLSIAGYTVGNEYKDIILGKFSKYIEYIDVFIQYEMRRIDFNDYDIGIVDYESLMNYYPIELINYPVLGLEEATIPLFKQVFYEGFSTDTIDWMKSITKVYDNFEWPNYKILFKILSYKYGNQDNASLLEQSLLDYENKFSFYNQKHRISLIICDYLLTKRAFIDIYNVDKKMRWTKKEEDKVAFIICISLPNDLKVSKIKIINKVLFTLSSNIELCQQLYENIEETYQKIFEEIVTKHFIRE